jgi:hypothetical protein
MKKLDSIEVTLVVAAYSTTTLALLKFLFGANISIGCLLAFGFAIPFYIYITGVTFKWWDVEKND